MKKIISLLIINSLLVMLTPLQSCNKNTNKRWSELSKYKLGTLLYEEFEGYHKSRFHEGYRESRLRSKSIDKKEIKTWMDKKGVTNNREIGKFTSWVSLMKYMVEIAIKKEKGMVTEIPEEVRREHFKSVCERKMNRRQLQAKQREKIKRGEIKPPKVEKWEGYDIELLNKHVSEILKLGRELEGLGINPLDIIKKYRR